MRNLLLTGLLASSVLASIGLATPAFAQTVDLTGESGTATYESGAGWGPSSVSVGSISSCCAVSFLHIPPSYSGAAATFTTQGSIGINVSASGTTGNLAITPNAGSTFTASLNTSGQYAPDVYDFNFAAAEASPTFTQSAPSTSANVTASLSFANSVSGEVCLVGCISFGTSLGSYNTSFTALGFNTAGSGSVTALGATLSGANGDTQTFKVKGTTVGSVSLSAGASTSSHPDFSLYGPAPFPPGAVVASSTNVASLNLNLTNIATAAANLPALSGSYGFSSFSAGYNLLTASLQLNETLIASTYVSELVSSPSVEFFDANNSPTSLLFTGKYFEDGAAYRSSIALNSSFLDYYYLSSADIAAGDYAVLTDDSTYSVQQDLDIDLGGSLDITALGVEFDGNQYNAVSQSYPVFNIVKTLVDSNSIAYGQTVERYDFPIVAPPPVITPSVPEPTTWITMLAGLGLTGATLRRRRQLLVA